MLNLVLNLVLIEYLTAYSAAPSAAQALGHNAEQSDKPDNVTGTFAQHYSRDSGTDIDIARSASISQNILALDSLISIRQSY